MNVNDLYRDVILDHCQHPRGREPITRSDTTSKGHNPACGDEVTVNLRVDNGVVSEIQVDSKGCAISTAAGSMLAQTALGMNVDELVTLCEEVREMAKTGTKPNGVDPGQLGVLGGVSQFPVRVKCATLPLATTMEAIGSLGECLKK